MSIVAAPAGAAAKAGDLIKIAGSSTVYYLGADSKRYIFPNEATYFSWYKDFSKVVTVSQTELEGYTRGAVITIRPGTKLIKTPDERTVYSVEPGGNLRSIVSEANAIALWGANWAKRVVDVIPAFMVAYNTGNPLTTGILPAGSLVKTAASADVYYFDGSNYRKFANEAAASANGYDLANAVTVAAIGTTGTAVAGLESTLTDVAGGAHGTINTGGSGLTVAISAMTPASASVPKNGSRVPMTKVNLTAANDGAVSVNSIVVKRIGLSAYTELDKVWAEKDGVIVATKKTVNSNDEATLTFAPALVISAGTTVSLDLVASLNSATGNIGLGIAAASAISAGGAAVSGSFPVNGSQMSPINYAVANLAITDGALTAYPTKVGDEKTEIGKFTIGFNGTGKDVSLKSIMLKNNGVEDMSKAVMNLYIEQAGNKVSESATIDGRYVTFNFPAGGLDLLKDDSSKVFYVKGDIIAKESTATTSLVLVLNKAADLVGIEKTTGFGVNVYNATSGTTAADGVNISTVTVSAGSIAVSKKLTSPSATTIIKGSDNVVFLANVRADENITADGLNVIYSSSASNASTTDQFYNARVWLNGVLLDSFDPSVSTASATVTSFTKAIDSTLTLNKGDNEVKVMVTAKTTAASAASFMVTLNSSLFSGMNPEYIASGNAVTDISGSAIGSAFTVQGAALAFVKNDGYAAAKVIVKGTSDVSLGKFVLKATNDTVKVTSIALSGNASTTSYTNISDMKLFVNGAQIGSTVDFGSSGCTFSSLNTSLTKDTSYLLELKGAFDSSATGGFQTTLTVNAQDSRGTVVAGVATATTTNFLVATAGSLNIALGGNTPPSAMLPARADLQEIAQVKFTATNDSIDLTELNFVNTSSSTVVATSTAADSIISGVYLYDGSTLIDSTVLISGIGQFNTNGKVTVPANGTKTLTVKVGLNNIVNDSTATNKDIQFALRSTNSKSSGGVASGLVYQDVIANSFRVRKTVPTVALMTLPTTVLSAGDQVISKFTVTADVNGDVSLKKVVLTYATTTNSSIVALTNNAVKVNGSTQAIASTLDAAAKTLTLDFGTTTAALIGAGSAKTFEILATLSVSGTTESVTTKIVEDTDYATTGAGNFVWSDGADILNPTWSNGKRVVGLTTATQALSK
jgi:hypothetical protein